MRAELVVTPCLPYFTVAFLPWNREAMIVPAKTCALKDPVFWNLNAEP